MTVKRTRWLSSLLAMVLTTTVLFLLLCPVYAFGGGRVTPEYAEAAALESVAERLTIEDPEVTSQLVSGKNGPYYMVKIQCTPGDGSGCCVYIVDVDAGTGRVNYVGTCKSERP